MHVHFDVLRGVPVETTLTNGNGSEREQLRATLQAQRLYVIDRGYAEYQLFQDIVDAHSDLLGRIRDNAVWTVVAERPLTPAARAAGVRSDRLVWLGGPQSGRVFQQPVRVLEVATGKTDAQGRPEILLLATSRLDLASNAFSVCRWTKYGRILTAATPWKRTCAVRLPMKNCAAQVNRVPPVGMAVYDAREPPVDLLLSLSGR